NATGGTYNVERSRNGGPFSAIATGLNGTAYSDTTVTGGLSYSYRIVAINNCPGTALTPMSTTSPSTSATSSVCSLPPVGDGNPSGAAGTAAHFIKTNGTVNETATQATSPLTA